MTNSKMQRHQDDNLLIADTPTNNEDKQPMAQRKPIINNKKKLWIVVGIIVGIVIIISVVIGILIANGASSKVTICTKMDYQGDIGPCIKTETVEIVAAPDNPNSCPVDTEPVYDVVGGIVGVKFVGCTKK